MPRIFGIDLTRWRPDRRRKRQVLAQKCYMPPNTTPERNFILFAVAVKLKALIE
jgi:hypothetical protein